MKSITVLFVLIEFLSAYEILYTNAIPLSLCSVNSVVGFKYNRAVAWTLFAEPTLKAGVWPLFTEWEVGSQYLNHETSDVIAISCQAEPGRTVQIQGRFPFAIDRKIQPESLRYWRRLWQEGKLSPIIDEDLHAPQLMCVTDVEHLQCTKAFDYDDLFTRM